MRAEQLLVVQQTGRVLLAIGPEAFDAFYDELFRIRPDARALFRSDLGVQKLKLLDMVATLISEARTGDGLHHTVGRSGERHRGYGVMPEHYAAGEQALAACLEIALVRILRPRCAPLGSRSTR